MTSDFSSIPANSSSSNPPASSNAQQKALTKAIASIRASLSLETIFETTVMEVRQLLKADRVGVFRFYPEQDWEGEFVSESVAGGWDSVLEKKVHDHCFGEQIAPEYQQGRIQAVADIHDEDLSDCHRDILRQFQVRANLVVPVLQGDRLWGLLCIHQCGEARSWQPETIEFAKLIAEHFSVAVQQASILEKAHQQAKQQQALTRAISQIRQSLNLADIFENTAAEVRQLLRADRVGVFRFYLDRDWEGEFVSESVTGDWDSVLEKKVYDHCFGEQMAPLYEQGRVQAVADIHNAGLLDCHRDILSQFQVRANLAVPLLQGDRLWGLLCIHQCSRPRIWEELEIQFAQQAAEQLGVALNQYEYVEQVQTQARQLAEAKEREKATERQKLLAVTIEKIRQSLNIEAIFQTTTQEVRQLLQVERVAIYRFNPDWNGEFVAEAVTEGWTPLVGTLPVIEDTFLQESQGGRYAEGETFAVDDIYQVGHSECHIALLEQFEAKAYAIVPIFQGEKLWGLLGAYQNSAAYHWETDEVELLAQVGSQLGVAIQQSEALQQVRNQTLKLEQAAERQQALAGTVEKIRQSLDIEAIFQTTTQEVRQLLQVERVAIYRFNPDWSGEFVADSIIDGWLPQPVSQSAIANSLNQPNAMGKYPRNEAFVPISQGEKLWGLLVAYQNSRPRYWQDEEMNLLAQIGTQLGIAIQQAELFKQTRQQTTELSQALQELQTTQSHLIQGEKMASLGQLVAGVAHEINNPVNFIYGNLSHVTDYLQQLLGLIALYQKHYPDPVPEIQQEVEAIELDFVCQDLPKMLASMGVGAERIRQIVLSLRTFARLDEAEKKPVNIHDGIDSTLLILQHRLKAMTHRPAIEVAKNYGDLPDVKCYASQLNQVFMNILSNGIEALEEAIALQPEKQIQPILQIRTNIIEGNHVSIQIKDNGSGMPPEVREKVFNPFFTTKPIGKGTGLGLSISYQIVVERHGGRLSCNSQVGRGTEFFIEIPL